MRNGIRFFFLGLVTVLTLGVSSAAGGSSQTLIVTPPSPWDAVGAFAVEALDGTQVRSLPINVPGVDVVGYSAAADGSVAYDLSDGSGASYGPLWLVRPNQTPLELDSSTYDTDPSISPDGSKVTFVRFDSAASTTSNIYVVNADGSGLERVASGGGNRLLNPQFSPDGGSIAYMCDALNYGVGYAGCGPSLGGTYSGSAIMLMNADGTDQRMIVANAIGGSLSWSPDGQSVATHGLNSRIVTYRTDGSDLLNADDPSREITHGNEYLADPQFTPDGTQILFELGTGLYSIGLDGTNEQQLLLGVPGFAVVPPPTGSGPPPTVTITLPFPDGPVVREMAGWCSGYVVESALGAYTACVPGIPGAESDYSVASNNAVVVSDGSHGEAPGEGPVWLSQPGKTPVELDPSPYDYEPSLSPDGSKVTFGRVNPTTGVDSIYTVGSDGSGLTRVASGKAGDRLSWPKFSPDGGSISYACSARDYGQPYASDNCGPLPDGTYSQGGIMLMKSDGSDKRQILDFDPCCEVGSPDYSWSPDGQTIALEAEGAHGGWQVFVYHADGSDLFDITDPARQITHQGNLTGNAPQFSADGTQLMYSVYPGSGATRAYVIGRDGSDPHRVYLAIDSAADDEAARSVLFVPPATGGAPPPTEQPTDTIVPAVRHVTYQTAARRLTRVDLTPQVSGQRYSATVRAGHVISQYPHARTRARLKRSVKLVLSRGARPDSFSLSVGLDGTGSGTVSSSPNGISCGSTCRHWFKTSSRVTLTATPSAGSTFAGWSGACSGTGACSVTMGKAQSVTATFTKNVCVVPSVKGRRVKAAKQAIVAHDCSVGAVERVFSRTVRKGRVISASPGAGKTLAQGSKVALRVSKGEKAKG